MIDVKATDFYKPKRCIECGATISDRSRSCKCRSCLNKIHYKERKARGYYEERRKGDA